MQLDKEVNEQQCDKKLSRITYSCTTRNFVRCNVKLANELFNLPKFYNQVFNCWFNLNEEPNSANEVLQEYIYLNKFVEINNKMVLDEEFIRPKTLKIGDIVKIMADF